jgi:colicin import membrane protein
MNRLQKKCFIATVGMHLLLVAVAVTGPAFLSSPSSTDDLQVLNFVPLATTDLPFAAGGNPNTKPPPPAPAPPVQPPPVKTQATAPQPEPKKAEVPAPEPAKPAAKSDEPDLTDSKPKNRLPDVSTEVVTRSTADRARLQKEATAAAQAQQRADAQRRAAQVGAAVQALREELSSSTSVDLLGPGSGGIPYANFKQAILSAYYNAWQPPAGIANENATAKAIVIIDRDGTVISARITEPSGEPAMDASVQRTLERVKFIAPLPDGAKESQRTVSIIFDLKAKKGVG